MAFQYTTSEWLTCDENKFSILGVVCVCGGGGGREAGINRDFYKRNTVK